ncbi:LytTR family DNA-binding domain-containing protein [Echinicola jeungdonensis]|uniref:LytR/AlgR family response regulator transcription factor n=1 Tax=Echinicola jeungdonensis TaxID=709343 RepID=A0ABV5J976_9BACT|nr:LytTR family DNA-binding domain-containing protein [Echinicola jeungdonensis]MDN3670514.1 LytTR family DNA-binding domain-containing protein [Echinicola jeungdonensis]
MKVLIVEDESLAAEKLAKMLKQYDDKIEVLDNLTSIKETVDWLASNPAPDLMMLDIRIDDGLSFEIFHQSQVECPVIFTTAYDQYAIRAFKVHSIDYLLKPIQYEKLAFSLDKLKNLKATYKSSSPGIDLDRLMDALQEKQNQYKSRFLVKAGNKIRTVKTTDIAYIYTDRKLNLLVTTAGDKYPLDQSLDELVQVLDPEVFFRANRQLILHIDAVSEIHPYFKGRVKLELKPALDTEIIISSEKTPSFKSWLDR